MVDLPSIGLQLSTPACFSFVGAALFYGEWGEKNRGVSGS